MKNWLMAVWLCAFTLGSQAVELQKQDIDIFLSNPTVVNSGGAPNVLIVLDNTANWNTPFDAEKNGADQPVLHADVRRVQHRVDDVFRDRRRQ